MLAALFIASNHSRRIYYRSNYIVGIVCPTVIALFALVVAILNSLCIPVITENNLLFNVMDFVCSTSNASYVSDINNVLNHNAVNVSTLIFVDVLLAGIMAYCVFLVIYAIKRYNVCAAEREEIIAKAVSKNE
jgi:hypothetical protein